MFYKLRKFEKLILRGAFILLVGTIVWIARDGVSLPKSDSDDEFLVELGIGLVGAAVVLLVCIQLTHKKPE